MPRWVVKQPDGKLALFSSIVDAFTAIDCTPEEMMDVLLDDVGRRDAADKIMRGIDDRARGQLTGTQDGALDGLGRWREAIRIIRGLHGESGLENVLSEFENAVQWKEQIK